jgi:ABC-type branched-subunit amino acid transport system substrate-binding protein
MSQTNFYQVGGDLRYQHPSYVKREADDLLYNSLKVGELCYIYNCRQMGKSSLAIQTMQRLRADGFACCFINLQDIGTDATADEWYFTFADKVSDRLKICCDLSAWWDQCPPLMTPVRRLSRYIETVVLQEIKQEVVIFIDEIDSTRRLKFNADDFFGLIRGFYNDRAQQPSFCRLRFTLLGVATPSDLIHKENATPFNIGKAIFLRGFQLQEAMTLVKGLEDSSAQPKALLREILLWTGGQPFLTQKCCKLIVESADVVPLNEEVNYVRHLVQQKLINNWENQDNPAHFKIIRTRLLDNKQFTQRILHLYQNILKAGEVRSNNSSEQWDLQLSGLVINQSGKLKIFNPVYSQIFNQDWLNQRIDEICPFYSSLMVWQESNLKTGFLKGQALKDALEWSKDKYLSDLDNHYLRASEKEESRKRVRNIAFLASSFLSLLIASIIGGQFIYYKFAFCQLERGIPGERETIRNETGEEKVICYTPLITSGESPVFLTSTNLLLDRGIELFKKKKYQDAMVLFERAMDGDSSDPIPVIFYNNARARARSQGNPLKLVVVAGIDLYEDSAKDILRGVALAQNEFNEKGGRNGRLLEIAIANDMNHEAISFKVANNLLAQTQKDLLGVIGHHLSEASKGAILVYERAGIAMVSATSSSSDLRSPVFYGTVNTTDVDAKNLTQLISNKINNNLPNSNIAVFYDSKSVYSNSLIDDIKKNFGADKVIPYDLNDFYSENNQPDRKIDQIIRQNFQAIIFVGNMQQNTLSVSLVRRLQEEAQRSGRSAPQLFGSGVFFEQSVLARVGDAMEGMILSTPCLDEKSDFTRKSKLQWKTSQILWRNATSYDATQALIAAIEAVPISEEPTAKSVLENLRTVQLPPEKTSGFGLQWDHNINIRRGYCLFEVKDRRFVPMTLP